FTTESTPCKLFTIMAAGRPAIAAVDHPSDTRELIREANCGICIEPENPKALADAINGLYSDANARNEFGCNGRRYVEKHFRASSIAQDYLELMQAAVGLSSPEVGSSGLVQQEIPD